MTRPNAARPSGPSRRALALGVVLDGQEWTVQTADDLPQSRMRVARLDFPTALTDQDLEHLRGLTAIRRLFLPWLRGANRSRAGPVRPSCRRCKSSVSTTVRSAMPGWPAWPAFPISALFSFNSMPATEAGLANLAQCVTLEDLGLGQTAASDATLERLRPLKNCAC